MKVAFVSAVALGLVIGGVIYLNPSGSDRIETDPTTDVAVDAESASTAKAEADPLPTPRREPVAPTPPYPWPEPEWRLEMRKALRAAKVDLEVNAGNILDEVEELGRRMPYPIDFDVPPARNLRFSPRRGELDGESVLGYLESITGRIAYLVPGGIRLTTSDRPAETDVRARIVDGLRALEKQAAAGGAGPVIEEPGAGVRATLEKLFPVRWEEQPASAIARDLQQRLDMPVEAGESHGREWNVAKISLVSDTHTLAQVLDEVGAATGLGWAIDGRRILFTDPGLAAGMRGAASESEDLKERPIAVVYKERPLHEVVADLKERIGAEVYVSRSIWEPDHPVVTLAEPEEKPLSRILLRLARELEARVAIRDRAVWIVRP